MGRIGWRGELHFTFFFLVSPTRTDRSTDQRIDSRAYQLAVPPTYQNFRLQVGRVPGSRMGAGELRGLKAPPRQVSEAQIYILTWLHPNFPSV